MEYVEIDVEKVIATTEKAALCLIDGEEFWIPWSQIEEGSEIEQKGDSGVAYVTEWFARKEGIPY